MMVMVMMMMMMMIGMTVNHKEEQRMKEQSRNDGNDGEMMANRLERNS